MKESAKAMLQIYHRKKEKEQIRTKERHFAADVNENPVLEEISGLNA